MNITDQDVFRRISVDRVHGSSVMRVASQYAYIHIDDNIEMIADSFSRHIEVLAVGVCDSEGRLLGIIERGELFHRLGRPFGRDILSRKSAIEVYEETECFSSSANVFAVAEAVENFARDRERIRYFGLVDETGRFSGLFSSIDILSYLGSITQQDIQLAGQLQSRMLSPSISLDSHASRFRGCSHSAKGMGGDFCYVHKLDENRIFFTVCDVSGKGAAASIITGLLWGMLRVYDWRKGLPNFIQEVNLALIQSFHLEKYLTGVFGIYNQDNREMILADMGHSHCYVVRGSKIRHIDSERKNLPVGIELNLEPSLLKITLKQGDVLACITDGLLEQENASGICRSADEWLLPLLNVPFEKCCTELEQQFMEFSSGVVQQDDISALFMKVGNTASN